MKPNNGSSQISRKRKRKEERKNNEEKFTKLLHNRKSKRSKKRNQTPTLLFSIINVRFPQNYEHEYRMIRHYNYVKNVEKNSFEDYESINPDSENEDSGNNNNSTMNVGTNAINRLIKEGKCTIQATVRTYDGHLSPDMSRTFSIKNGKGVFIPFIEPYFIYEAEFMTVNNNQWVDYSIKKIKDIKLSKLGFDRIFKSNLMYLLSVEMYLGKNQCQKIVRILKKKKEKNRKEKHQFNRNIVTIKDFEVGFLDKKLKKHQNEFNNTLYFIYSKALEAISIYEEVITFDIRKLCNRINMRSISILKEILLKTPWRLAVPTIRDKYFIKEFDIQDFKKIEKLYNSKISENEDYKNFPEEYYWALHLSKSIHTLYHNNNTGGLHMFFFYYDLLQALSKQCFRLGMREKYFDKVINTFKTNNCKSLTSNADVLNMLKSFPYWKDGMKILADENYLFICRRPGGYIQKEKLIGRRVYDVFETNNNQVEDEEFEECVREQVDVLYSNNWNMFDDLRSDDRIYEKKIWNMQKECLIQFRFLLFRNIGYCSKIKTLLPEDYEHLECVKILNQKQKDSHVKCVSDRPIVFCIGLPGTGKTEVVKSVIESLHITKDSRIGILLCGVNGITVNVLRQRIEDVCKQQGNVFLQIFTIDMAYAKEMYGNGIGINKIDTLIIDEIQNADMKRIFKILPMIKNLRRIRLFGDFNQIEPICIGKIFRNLYEAMKFRTSVVTELEENNRVRMNPNSSSIVSNFESISRSRYYKGDQVIRDDDEGTTFITAGDVKCVKKIMEIYKNSDDPTKIQMITPMRRTRDRLNNLLAERIMLLVQKKKGWIPSKFKIEFCKKNGRRVIRVGCKIRFSYNYQKALIKTDTCIISSDAVFNGERGWVIEIKFRYYKFKKQKEGIYHVKLLMCDGTIKNIIVGNRHVDKNDIGDGYFTTIDALLGGQSPTIILYLGDNNMYPCGGAGRFQSAILTNLGWVDRCRIMSAISRASKKLYVMAPRVIIEKKDLVNLCNKRERRQGRILFFDENTFKEDRYDLDAKKLLILMSDLEPAERNSDLDKYFDSVLNVTYSVKEQDFMGRLNPTIENEREEEEESDKDEEKVKIEEC